MSVNKGSRIRELSLKRQGGNKLKYKGSLKRKMSLRNKLKNKRNGGMDSSQSSIWDKEQREAAESLVQLYETSIGVSQPSNFLMPYDYPSVSLDGSDEDVKKRLIERIELLEKLISQRNALILRLLSHSDK